MIQFINQKDAMDCGSTCLAMVAGHYGRHPDRDRLRELCDLGKEGVSLLGVSKAAEQIGFKTVGGRLTFDSLATKAPLPCIAYINCNWALRLLIVIIFFVVGMNIHKVNAQEVFMQKSDSLSIRKIRKEEIDTFILKLPSELYPVPPRIKTLSFDKLNSVERETSDITFEALRIDKNLQLRGTSTSGFMTNSAKPSLHSITKGITLKHPVFNQSSVITGGEIGFTSFPLTQMPVKQYNVFIGTEYTVSKRLNVAGVVNVGRFLGERYVNPTTSLSLSWNSNWNFMLKGGLYQSNTMFGSYQAGYALFRAQYTSDIGLYLYGQGFTSYANRPYASMSPILYHYGYSGIGGGVGYNILGSGNVGVGVDYIYDPMTGKMIPKYYVDLTGTINLGVKSLLDLLKDLFEE